MVFDAALYILRIGVLTYKKMASIIFGPGNMHALSMRLRILTGSWDIPVWSLYLWYPAEVEEASRFSKNASGGQNKGS